LKDIKKIIKQVNQIQTSGLLYEVDGENLLDAAFLYPMVEASKSKLIGMRRLRGEIITL